MNKSGMQLAPTKIIFFLRKDENMILEVDSESYQFGSSGK